MTWAPSDPARWSILGLADPTPSSRLAQLATVADALAYALIAPGSRDPIEGIVDGVCIEMAGLAAILSDTRAAEVVEVLARRLEVAMLLLRWSDNRERIPTEPPDDPGGSRDATLPPEPDPTSS